MKSPHPGAKGASRPAKQAPRRTAKSARKSIHRIANRGAAALVELQDVSVVKNGGTVLHNVDFHISPGEVVTLVGPNGSGKTTLLNVIIGALAATSGRVHRGDCVNIGYVPQKLHIETALPLTVRRFLALPSPASRKNIMNALEDTDAEHLATRQMTTLSGGEFQRVLLARAILADPKLLILDEATQGLDQAGSAAFYRRIAALRERIGCAVLMASHELHVVMAASDRVVCLNGHVCCQGTPKQVSMAPEYVELFGTGAADALAIYKHTHDHVHHTDPLDHAEAAK